MRIIVGLALIFAVLVASVAVTIGSVMALRRGRGGTSGSLGRAMLEVEALFDPAKRHVVEAEAEEQAERDESGDDT